jgi:hypothetical protein
MNESLAILLVVVLWVVLNRFILPRMGIRG